MRWPPPFRRHRRTPGLPGTVHGIARYWTLDRAIRGDARARRTRRISAGRRGLTLRPAPHECQRTRAPRRSLASLARLCRHVPVECSWQRDSETEIAAFETPVDRRGVCINLRGWLNAAALTLPAQPQTGIQPHALSATAAGLRDHARY